MAVGIYYFKNKINGKYYVGQSVNLGRRYSRHKRFSNKEQHPSSETKLYRAFRKYGFDNFEYKILEECERDELNEREKFYIEKYDSVFNGYNLTLGGDGASFMETEKVKGITDRLLEGEKNAFEIAEEFETTDRTVRAINTGET